MEKRIEKISVASLKSLKPALANWQKLMDVDFWDDRNDTPWWYNERALLSLFAGAVWKCREGWAFEEFTTDKWKATKKGKRKKSKGRGDLIFGIGNRGFVAEAKQCWPILGTRSQGVTEEIISKTLRAACRDCSSLPSDGYKRLGIVFVVPRIRMSKENDTPEILENFLSLISSFKNATSAWIFPREKRSLKGGDGYLYPGIVLLVKPL
jgi:hypothetical protein